MCIIFLQNKSKHVFILVNVTLLQHCADCVFSGPRLFLPCPMDVEGSRVWFMDLWNYSLVPYVLEAVREGLQVEYLICIIVKRKEANN
jgi:hypothetical protein